jgi:hypothetical protein
MEYPPSELAAGSWQLASACYRPGLGLKQVALSLRRLEGYPVRPWGEALQHAVSIAPLSPILWQGLLNHPGLGLEQITLLVLG